MRLHKIEEGRFINLERVSVFAVHENWNGGSWNILGFADDSGEILFKGFETQAEADRFLEEFMVELGYEVNQS